MWISILHNLLIYTIKFIYEISRINKATYWAKIPRPIGLSALTLIQKTKSMILSPVRHNFLYTLFIVVKRINRYLIWKVYWALSKLKSRLFSGFKQDNYLWVFIGYFDHRKVKIKSIKFSKVKSDHSWIKS